jgi:hypothetical protein
MKTNENQSAHLTVRDQSRVSSPLLRRGMFVLKFLSATVFCGVLSAACAHADALTGLYTQVAVGDPDFGGGYNAGSTLATGLVGSQLGPDGLPVLTAAGITRLGTSADMNPITHELLWWTAGADPYVSLDAVPVRNDSMPLNWGYPNMNFYPTGQSGDSSYYRTVHWEGTFSLGSASSITLSFPSLDDDAWVFVDGSLVLEDHYGYPASASPAYAAGTHSIDIFYDDRIPVFDAIQFTSSVPLSPVPEPDTLALFVAGVVTGLAYGWQRRRQAALDSRSSGQ